MAQKMQKDFSIKSQRLEIEKEHKAEQLQLARERLEMEQNNVAQEQTTREQQLELKRRCITDGQARTVDETYLVDQSTRLATTLDGIATTLDGSQAQNGVLLNIVERFTGASSDQVQGDGDNQPAVVDDAVYHRNFFSW